MFNKLKKFYSSNVVDSIKCDLLNRSCTVTYNNGKRYFYENVKRRAMINLLTQPNISGGFWVNDNLLSYVSGAQAHKLFYSWYNPT